MFNESNRLEYFSRNILLYRKGAKVERSQALFDLCGDIYFKNGRRLVIIKLYFKRIYRLKPKCGFWSEIISSKLLAENLSLSCAL